MDNEDKEEGEEEDKEGGRNGKQWKRKGNPNSNKYQEMKNESERS